MQAIKEPVWLKSFFIYFNPENLTSFLTKNNIQTFFSLLNNSSANTLNITNIYCNNK